MKGGDQSDIIYYGSPSSSSIGSLTIYYNTEIYKNMVNDQFSSPPLRSPIFSFLFSRRSCFPLSHFYYSNSTSLLISTLHRKFNSGQRNFFMNNIHTLSCSNYDTIIATFVIICYLLSCAVSRTLIIIIYVMYVFMYRYTVHKVIYITLLNLEFQIVK